MCVRDSLPIPPYAPLRHSATEASCTVENATAMQEPKSCGPVLDRRLACDHYPIFAPTACEYRSPSAQALSLPIAAR
jgi:hypothetical protein